jgi:hypothetical protein
MRPKIAEREIEFAGESHACSLGVFLKPGKNLEQVAPLLISFRVR